MYVCLGCVSISPDPFLSLLFYFCVQAIGADSQWYPYLSLLPEREYLPVYWSKEELEHLEGTELEATILVDKEYMKADYDTIVKEFFSKRSTGKKDKKNNKNVVPTLELFYAAASLVASRAFHVDYRHGKTSHPSLFFSLSLHLKVCWLTSSLFLFRFCFSTMMQVMVWCQWRTCSTTKPTRSL